MSEPLRGTLLRDEPMARHTSWRVGGPVDRLYTPADVEDLANFLAALPEEDPIIWVGLGSNLLVRDGGIRGTVILVHGVLAGLTLEEGCIVVAGAGAACAKIARFSAEHGLSGAEFFAGIPGTIGGALAMNAGAFGTETWDIVRSVETIDRRGRRTRRKRSEFQTGYRTVNTPEGQWYIAAEFALQPDPGGGAAARIRELLAQRAATQPTGVLSCGSVFRNPEGDHAGRLIEACGLKGTRVGHASVSSKHANFIINEGGARAADIEELVRRVGQAVKTKMGVDLLPEVRIIGDRT